MPKRKKTPKNRSAAVPLHLRLPGIFLAVLFATVAAFALGRPNVWSWSTTTTATRFFLACAVALSLTREKSERGFWLGFSITGWLFYFGIHDALQFIGLPSYPSVFQRLIDTTESWASGRFGEDAGYFKLSANELSVLLLATLAGYFCRWTSNRTSTRETLPQDTTSLAHSRRDLPPIPFDSES